MKNILKKILLSSGYDLFKHDARHHDVFCRGDLLKDKGLTVLDVGANVGQFAQELRQHGFAGEIISFEPLTAAHSALSKSASTDSHWAVFERVAIGSEPGESEINVSGNSVSSSLLPMEQCHLDLAPQSAYVGTEKVKVMRLDDAVESLDRPESVYYLKVDTQGFERHVLEGAPTVLSDSKVVELELSLTPTYGGCLLFSDGVKFMEDAGFQIHSLYPVLQDRKTGQLLQLNAFFVRA